jgi:hypothetical protein
MGQDQAAPLIQRLRDGLKRLELPAKVLGYYGDVSTAHRVNRMISTMLSGTVGTSPARIQKTARYAERCGPGVSSGWVTAVRTLPSMPGLRPGNAGTATAGMRRGRGWRGAVEDTRSHGLGLPRALRAGGHALLETASPTRPMRCGQPAHRGGDQP